MSSMSKDALARAIAQYVVDAHAVAEAMLRRGSPLAVLVPAQPLDRPATGVEQDEPVPGADVA
jgi:hypothetical protein